MSGMKERIADFLGQKRIAVAGVSRKKDEAANFIYRKLRGAGYEVFPVNPMASELEGDTCYDDLSSIPGGVDGVVIATSPKATEDLVRECAELGISRVWIHRSFGTGSYSEAAVNICSDNGVEVIPGGCPMMYCEPVDVPHRCMRWVINLTRDLPRLT
jgi:predicted CoA-binding protein